jgi:LPS-assembly protein
LSCRLIDITGTRAAISLQDKTGRVENARVFMPDTGFHISADLLEQKSPDRFTALGAKMSTCAGERPDWSFSASKIDLAVEGYATLHDTAFRIKDIPVLYSPYFLLPAKRERQTGFLTPQPGSSRLDGFRLDIPFYWAISDQSDATFYAGIKTARGVMEGAEYRYVLGDQSWGTIQGSFLRDALADTVFVNLDGTPRLDKDRWWVRAKANQALPLDFKLLADIDATSDQDYLREFVSGYQGFTESNRYFTRYFGRSLQEATDQVRESSVVVYRDKGVHYVSAETHYYENLVPGQAETTLQRLPTLRYEATEHPLLGSPLHWQLATRYDDFWRNAPTSLAPNGQRIDLEPTLRLPLSLGRYVSFIPTASLRETAYQAQGQQNGQDVSGFHTREDYALGGTLSTQMSRVFTTGLPTLPAVKHIMQPELDYVYRPGIGQGSLPQFTPQDRLAAENFLALAVTNDLIGKLRSPEGFSYVKLARLKLSEGVDFNRLSAQGGLPARPALPLSSEAEIVYGQFYFDAEAQWDWQQGNFSRYGILTTWTHPAGHSATLDYQFVNGLAEQINFTGVVKVLPAVALYTIQRDSVQAGRVVESTFGIRYEAACWAIDLSYFRQPFDEQINVRFSLGGIGQLGSFGFKTIGGT